MKELLEKILGLFKSKNIELTAEEQAEFFKQMLSAKDDKANPTPIEIPDTLKHNEKFIRDMQASFNTVIETIKKEREQEITAYKAENEKLMKLIGDETERRTKGEQAMEEQAAKDKAAKIAAVIEDAVKAQKIPANNEELKAKYKTFLETNFDDGKTIIDALPGAKPAETTTIKSNNNNNGGLPDHPFINSVNTEWAKKNAEIAPKN